MDKRQKLNNGKSNKKRRTNVNGRVNKLLPKRSTLVYPKAMDQLIQTNLFYYIPNVLPAWFSQYVYRSLVSFVQDKPTKSTAFGFDEPRITCFFAKSPNHPNMVYSGVEQKHYAWLDFIALCCTLSELLTGQEFDCCHSNWYRNGLDSVGLHADNDARNKTICSWSFGATRVLDIVTADELYSVPMFDGSVVVMLPGMQEQAKHKIDKLDKSVGHLMKGRVNLTFRQQLSGTKRLSNQQTRDRLNQLISQFNNVQQTVESLLQMCTCNSTSHNNEQ